MVRSHLVLPSASFLVSPSSREPPLHTYEESTTFSQNSRFPKRKGSSATSMATVKVDAFQYLASCAGTFPHGQFSMQFFSPFTRKAHSELISQTQIGRPSSHDPRYRREVDLCVSTSEPKPLALGLDSSTGSFAYMMSTIT